jgi:aryl-alcohol dehydrogenase-like predicted oxidoreductase
LAAEKGCTPGQLALAWILAQGEDMVPIPGTKRLKYLEENMGAANVALNKSDLPKIDARCEQVKILGARYSPEMMGLINVG